MTIENPDQKTEVIPTANDAGNPSEAEQLKAQLAAQTAEINEIANSILANIPDGLKALIPDELTPAAKVKWYQKAQAAGLLKRPSVPETDTSKPSLLPPKVNPNELPPIARMSYGYGKQ